MASLNRRISEQWRNAVNENRNDGFEGRGAPGSFGDDVSKTRSQTGRDTQGRSPDYDDDRLGDDKLIDGRHATDLNLDGTRPSMDTSGASAGGSSASAQTPSHHAMGDNTDGMGRDRTDQVAADETGKLISADKVIGTAVYNSGGDHLGTIHSVMLHKISGRVAYAVMSLGGFLGIGERYHPLPWDVLTYDEEKGGYNIDKSDEQLRGAPHYSREEIEHLDYGQSGNQIRSYYGVGMRGSETRY
jgi:hypothetical protein